MRVCAEPNCPNIVERGRCTEHQQAKRYQERRFYSGIRGVNYGRRWRRARDSFLAEHPFCVDCKALATDVDHETPHRGDYERFWDETNWRSRCHSCHSAKTARETTWGGVSNV
jgi:5-methylcytosine-specific restriction protein A